jgi:hypothetical protein
MILYKYVTYDNGIKIFTTNSIGFRPPEYFNDPFEISAFWSRRSPNTFRNIAYKLNDLVTRDTWSTSYGVLSLTRAPTNALMWAHYARGGCDSDHATRLTSLRWAAA